MTDHVRDEIGAFVPGQRFRIEGRGGGPLSGLTFAAKDLFDVAGHVTGCGSPDWAASHGPAARSAAAVELLLAAGARLAGKTVTDEISLGLSPAVVRRVYGVLPGLLSAGTTVLLVEQDVSQALVVASRIQCLLEGRTTLLGRPEEFSPQRIEAAYFGLAGAAGQRGGTA